MTREQIDAKLAQCNQWARWKPVQPRSVLALALHDEGYYGGIEVRAMGRRTYQALVIAVHACQWIQPGDIAVFDLGKSEQLQTIAGQTLCWLNEQNCDGVDDDFFKPPAQTSSGLWIPA